MDMQSVWKTLYDLNPAYHGFANFKAVLDLFINGVSQISDDECITGPQEDLTVELLFSKDTVRDPNRPFARLTWLSCY